MFFKSFLVMLLFMITVSFPIKAQQSLPNANELMEDVGDIPFNPKTDKVNFYLCHKNFIIQYYNFETSYLGGTKAIKNFILTNYIFKPSYKLTTGFLTVRFIINCKGETDRFRLSQLNNDYKNAIFNADLTEQILGLCKKLNLWIPGKDKKGNIYDSYYYLNFRFVKGRIITITP